jgi:hypothetical protein
MPGMMIPMIAIPRCNDDFAWMIEKVPIVKRIILQRKKTALATHIVRGKRYAPFGCSVNSIELSLDFSKGEIVCRVHKFG